MFWKLLALMLVWPMLEIGLLLWLQWPLEVSALEVLITAAVGWNFARREDLSLWSELVSDVRNGRVPTREGLDAMLVVLGGWALMIPGIISDILGAVMLIPAVRELALPGLRVLLREQAELRKGVSYPR
ncbi:MAG: FxsA family protein [Deltaproteobacteria bacterium]|nr:FxsA family protein [Deltaproteobacteria bacterium]